MAWLAVDKNREEYLYEKKPIRMGTYWWKEKVEEAKQDRIYEDFYKFLVKSPKLGIVEPWILLKRVKESYVNKVYMKYLIKWDFNWADEFDVTGFSIYSEEVYNDLIDKVEKYPELVEDFCSEEHYFGTNEWVNILEKDLKSILYSAEAIPSEDATIIEKYIGEYIGLLDIPGMLHEYINKGIDDEV